MAGLRVDRTPTADCVSEVDERLEEMAWGRYQYLPREIEIEEKQEAVRTSREWGDRKSTIWKDGSRPDDGSWERPVWWQEEGPAPPWWTGGRFHLREDKEAFDAEMCAHH